MNISIVLPEHIEMIWPRINDYMQGAADYSYGRFNAADIKTNLLERPEQLWIAFDDNKVYGAVVTEIIEYPLMNALVMHFTGGVSLKKWKQPMLETLQRFAKERGCKVIESHGRRGWEKIFKNDGFTERFMVYELPV